MDREDTDKCPMCGRFVSPAYGFYAKEQPDSDLSYMAVFCDPKCADQYEQSYLMRDKQFKTRGQINES